MLPGLSEDETKRLIVSVGTHRSGRPLTPCEIALTFQKAINHGASLQDCADAVMLEDTTWVSRFLRTLKLDQSVRHLVGWGHAKSNVPFTSATEVARLDKKDHLLVFTSIIEYRFSSNEIRELVQIRLRSGRSIEKCIDEVVALRPTIVRQHVFVGAVTSIKVKGILRSMTQNGRDAVFRDIVIEKLPCFSKCTIKLGIESFAIITDESTSAILLRELPNFEGLFNARLEEHFVI